MLHAEVLSRVTRKYHKNGLLCHVYPIKGMAKPRMTQTDRITLAKIRSRRRLNSRELQRQKILCRWLAYSDELLARNVRLDIERYYHVIFVLPMTASWSQTKQQTRRFQPHQQTPDKDNLEKALLDVLYGDDKAAWDGRVTKVWGDHGQPWLLISQRDLDVQPYSIERYIAESN